ncbi:MAG: bifunctional DNA-formamidopyrimidine glycosylase/DNA-(apurinic or apyrimidinic site) lyase [Candidatus Spechtbacterales bacterium]|nr:bifunctional DNA-formamidopyrimidine glycosylase/DNA-(apurinic or apyrimidinic site) lyase [Candidatus Spechtbacterales bacterium]
MPEVIEAEITKQKLALAIKGKRILRFRTDWARGLESEEGSVAKTNKALKGLKVKNIDREGKVVVINLEKGKTLSLHQRMSGHIRYADEKNAKLGPHAHFIFYLDDGSKFALIDPRKFGTVWFGSNEWLAERPYIKKLGENVLDIGKKDFNEIFNNSKAQVKSFMLRQDKLAGLGNIAVDEILWKARIHPKTKVNQLTAKQKTQIYKAMYSVLADVLRHGGTSMSDWYHPDGKIGKYQERFKIYDREFCPGCRSKIKKIKIAGRGTYFCPRCQLK